MPRHIRALRLAKVREATDLANLAHRAYSPWVRDIDCIPEPMKADWEEVTQSQEVWVLPSVSRPGFDASLALKLERDHLLIWSIAIGPMLQGAGFGRALLSLAERRAAALERNEIRLYTHAQMKRNIAIYELAGYSRTALEDRGDRVVQHMAKPLVISSQIATLGVPASCAVEGKNALVLLRAYSDRDASPIRELFRLINRELAPQSLAYAFEQYIALAEREEIDRIPDYYGAGPGRGFWVAEDVRGHIVGMFGLEPGGNGAAELRRMYVAPTARGRGLASVMLAEAERFCKTSGVDRIVLSTSELQPAAIALYRRAGYSLVREEVADQATNKTVGSRLKRFHFEKDL